ncbi:AraC family transcriptional regulator [Shewanella loihica]|uniref:Transcriptional regulator, AraC family n=1 Tax=Shewanella loihica (strain ATCC BAA-1088 / PV-4) TaxID=323850 RepID=A3QHH0_SHELP|nr:AraC family transcriptional regulator [Shewanella loihica]ABO24918.1 transcriptional regulator, AraC family [Shewanella loihica PV-4]
MQDKVIPSLSAAIAKEVERRTQGVDWCETEIAGLDFYRQSAPTSCSVCVVEPSIALVVQGAKAMTLGEQTFRYDPSRFLITSLDLPAKMQVLEASEEAPYLGVVIKLDLAVMSDLMLQTPLTMQKETASDQGMILGATTPKLLGAISRLVNLLDEPESIAVLAPLIKREIYWRVLMSEQGARLRQIVSAGSHGLRIARTIEWLKVHYDQHLSVDSLADMARMSKSTFHHHFRRLTSMSPLQYQKRLRLLEARRLMLGEDIDASAAAYRVGYESPSQFSREYSRLFGASPKKDVATQWQ